MCSVRTTASIRRADDAAVHSTGDRRILRQHRLCRHFLFLSFVNPLCSNSISSPSHTAFLRIRDRRKCAGAFVSPISSMKNTKRIDKEKRIPVLAKWGLIFDYRRLINGLELLLDQTWPIWKTNTRTTSWGDTTLTINALTATCAARRRPKISRETMTAGIRLSFFNPSQKIKNPSAQKQWRAARSKRSEMTGIQVQTKFRRNSSRACCDVAILTLSRS